MKTLWTIICFTFPKIVSRKTPSEHRIFASREKRLCHLLEENVLVSCGSDGMMESFGETRKVLLRFIQRDSLAISCVSSPTRVNSFLARSSLLPVAPTDCQDSIPANFRSRARKHVSSHGRREKADNVQMRFCQAKMRRENLRFEHSYFFQKL